jgi:hypothetical protein
LAVPQYLPQVRWNRRRRFSMTDTFDMPAQRTLSEVPLASRSRPSRHVPVEEQVHEALPSAGAGALDSIREQKPLAAPEPVSSRAPRRWVHAALGLLLALLLMAGAYWYVTGVTGTQVTDDPYLNIGESGISTDVSGIVKDVDTACSSSSCVSPRSRLSPRAIVGRPESRQGNLHLAALHLHLEACPPMSTTFGGS